ncbi:MAG: amidohydrolase family protein [Sphingorhabdus sp.]
MIEFDTVIRGGTIVDGTGAEPFVADLAISRGQIVAIGKVPGRAATEIDASGRLVTPGFVDIHTHYDGQVTWDNCLAPSLFHGVTTAVIGNCGVGFAPCRADAGSRDAMVRLMEGVEDIPHPVLTEGLPWTWETFPEYLEFLASRHYDMDIAAYVPHAPLRVFVMGERGANREPATADDISRMCALLEQALDVGALGIATSRSLFHRSSNGNPIPTYQAAQFELLAFAQVLRRKGKGVFQIVEDIHLPDANLDAMRELARESGRPLTFSIGTGNTGPYAYPALLEQLAAANAEGLVMKGQLMPRGIGMILGVELTLNPFYTTATYAGLAGLPLSELLTELRRPEIRAAILAEPVDPDPALVLGRAVRDFEHMFLLGEEPDYEQPQTQSIAGLARAAGIPPEELAYDILVEGQSGGKLYLAMANFADGSLDAVGEILSHPDVVLGLGDGGAHVGTICDASYSTFALTHWARDRKRGRKSVADMVHRMTKATAQLIGLDDRGELAIGKRADINVINLERLELCAPVVRYDLPSGGRRLVQKAKGYDLTMVAGEIVARNDEPSGLLPGRLVRTK